MPTLPRALHLRSKVACSSALALLLALGASAPAIGQNDVAPQASDALRLIVVVVIDQFRGDSLQRYERLFGADGFRRLCDGGVWYQNAHYDHAHTDTAAGHATISTGSDPSAHGLISDDWIDRQTGRAMNCVSDPSSPVVGMDSGSDSSSPVQLCASTFADEWIFATAGRGRAFGVSGKNRGAILPVGKAGKAFWYNSGAGRMVTSRYYYAELPAWAVEFNRVSAAEKYAGKSWERATRDDDGVPSAADDRSFEGGTSALGRTFPHRLTGGDRGRGPGGPGGGAGDGDRREEGAGNAGGSGGGGLGRGGFGGRGGGFGPRLSEQVKYTPFGDAITIDFALELIRAEALGKKSALDVLTISLSSNDHAGHAFGPDSVEAKEMSYSLDRAMARLLQSLDQTIGKQQYLLVLTSDHGVAYSPESVSDRGFAAKRYSFTDMTKQVRRGLNFTFRYLDWDAGFSSSGFYFDPEALRRCGVSPDALEKTAAEVIRATPGIAAAYTRTDILSGKLPDTDIARSVRSSYHAARSPDVFFVPEPYWVEGTGPASHGTPYNYDTHVPLLFYGADLKPKRVLRPTSIRDIAPTLTAILGCAAPSASQGVPLPEIAEGVERKPLRS